jgi:hypothetical protein
MPKQTTERLQSERAELLDAIEAANSILENVTERRRQHALAARRGDTAAIAALAEIERDEARARTDIETAKLAIEAIDAELVDARDGEAADGWAALVQRAKALAGKIGATSDEIDAALAGLAALLDRRRALIDDVLRLGVATPRQTALASGRECNAADIVSSALHRHLLQRLTLGFRPSVTQFAPGDRAALAAFIASAAPPRLPSESEPEVAPHLAGHPRVRRSA